MAKTNDINKKKRSQPKNPDSAFVRNLTKLMRGRDNKFTLKEISRLCGGTPISTIQGWLEGHNPKIDAIHRLLKNLKSEHGLEFDFKEFLTGEPPLVAPPQLRPEDLFEEGTITKTGIFKVTLVELVPKGSKLPKGRK
ncbi:hypothetical protein [Pseudobdellovibrio exovorus]|uniref:Uncharacterized protein n=1 Tax=Pseudobdellovibrio exovorus JSS TaxID=1184267 RepID=M4V841_9BACT|nr:hypothetical protein [Pseudobdellovibrio exovorus]AGH95383.1 hypothetical protein A11Q_1167 [Pseudobdellovibrio exovorus JSS]